MDTGSANSIRFARLIYTVAIPFYHQLLRGGSSIIDLSPRRSAIRSSLARSDENLRKLFHQTKLRLNYYPFSAIAREGKFTDFLHSESKLVIRNDRGTVI